MRQGQLHLLVVVPHLQNGAVDFDVLAQGVKLVFLWIHALVFHVF